MRTDDPNVSSSALIGVIGAIVLVVLIVALQGFFMKAKRDEIERKAAGHPVQELADLRSEQVERLTAYRWVDRKKGVVAIPVERAMEIVVREWRERRQGLAR